MIKNEIMQHYLSDQNEKTFIDERKPKIDLSGQKCNLTKKKKKFLYVSLLGHVWSRN